MIKLINILWLVVLGAGYLSVSTPMIAFEYRIYERAEFWNCIHRSLYFYRMKLVGLFSIVVLLMVSCSAPESPQKEQKDEPEEQEREVIIPNISDSILTYQLEEFETSVIVKMPKSDFKGTILVLQGWNFPNTHWSDSSNLEELASNAGFALVMPDMGKSIYHKRIYDQTRKDWQKYPTRTWLVDTLMNDLRTNYNLFHEQSSNFVMGLSTGGRGALIVAQENPEVFTAGCSLSGDYDQSAFPGDNLYRGYFGTNPDAWNDDENPVSFIKEWSVPMYVAHGEADSIVSIAHHNRLVELVDSAGISQDGWAFRVDSLAGHNYDFWAAEVEAIIQYFQGFLRDH